MKKNEQENRIAQLKEELEELKTIISLMPGNVYWQNKEGVYQGCNKNLAQIHHLDDPKDIIGKTNNELLKKEYLKKIKKVDQEVLTTLTETYVEELGYDSFGNPRTYLTQKKPIIDSHGNITGLLGISFDITDRKKNEKKLKIAKQKAETAIQAKSQFLAIISHELRTPLTSILGFANLIEQPALPSDKKHEYIQHIINSGNYLLSLINSLLDYNKLETNKNDLILLPLNLKELIASIVSMLSSTAKIKNLFLNMKYEENAPQRIVSNSRALSQILINLIGNAIKFTEKGGVTVSVECIKTTSKSTVLQITVEDTGIGIPADEQELIFKSFYQAGDAYTRNSTLTGTGLGLAIVEKLVKLIDGKIEVSSVPGQGSTFFVTATFATISSDDTPWVPYAATVKMLVAQDDPSNSYIDAFLANSIYEVVPSKEVMDNLLSAQRNLRPYDILIIDNHLTGIDAKDLLQDVRHQKDLFQPLLIILSDKCPPPQEKKLSGEIYLNPITLKTTDFQMELKLAWEAWHTQATRPPITLPSSRDFYILLVEDNPLIQIIHKSMLEELGCKVDVAESAAEALEMLKNNYDMLFVDIGLRDITGFELITQVRRQRSIVAHVPIIVLTGYSEEEERQHCMRVGANEVSVKPVSKDTLEKILDRYIKK